MATNLVSTTTPLISTCLSGLNNIPDEVHWLCDKIEPGPGGIQIHCSTPLQIRQRRTIEALIVICCAVVHPSQNWIKQKLTAQLSRCPQCVKNYYPTRKNTFEGMRKMSWKNADHVWSRAAAWDIERVEPVLEQIYWAIQQKSSTMSWYDSFIKNKTQRNAVYECFCCPELLESFSVKFCFTEICKMGRLSACVLQF